MKMTLGYRLFLEKIRIQEIVINSIKFLKLKTFSKI